MLDKLPKIKLPERKLLDIGVLMKYCDINENDSIISKIIIDNNKFIIDKQKEYIIIEYNNMLMVNIVKWYLDLTTYIFDKEFKSLKSFIFKNATSFNVILKNIKNQISIIIKYTNNYLDIFFEFKDDKYIKNTNMINDNIIATLDNLKLDDNESSEKIDIMNFIKKILIAEFKTESSDLHI
jgi:hypothetical protein